MKYSGVDQLNIKYRPDIDGLRAVAVVAVILHHVSFSWLPAGFLGVDIFFVISGFLITSLVRAEIEAGTFSLLTFYARRIRRIYPALLVVIVVTLLAGSWLMLPDSFYLAGQSAVWAAFGLSNLYFLSQVDYFSPDADTFPLLHTWSLGVEEQFYFVWPLLMALALPLFVRSKGARVLLPLSIVVASLTYAWWLRSHDTSALFFLPFARAWELALGAVAAFAPPLRGRVSSFVVSLIGIAAVALALVVGRPGPLPPLMIACVGATLIVWPRAQLDPVARLLGSRVPRFVGLVSYSAYLWHWPILILLRSYFYFGEIVPVAGLVAYFVAVGAISVLSWRFIEMPFRRKGGGRGAIAVGSGVVVAAVVALAAMSIVWTAGYPQRFPPEVSELAKAPVPPVAAPAASAPVQVAPAAPVQTAAPGAAIQSAETDASPSAPTVAAVRESTVDDATLRRCWVGNSTVGGASAYTADRCIVMDPDRPNVLVIGDSHANQYRGAFPDMFPEISFSFAAASGCKPVLGTTGTDYCVDLMRRMLEVEVAENRFDAVVLSAMWRDAEIAEAALATAEYLRTYTNRIVVLGPNNEYRKPLPELLAYGALRGKDLATKNERMKAPRESDAAFKASDLPPQTSYFAPLDIICPEGLCRSRTDSGRPMLMDKDHLSSAGTREVLSALRAQGLFDDLLKP